MKIAQILYAGSWGEVSPETIEQGLGGRETAMIKLAEAWAKQGHEVTNFVNVEQGRRFESDNGFHEYIPIQLCRPMLQNMPWDAAIAWELPSIFDEPRILKNTKVRVCEMQVAHFPHQEMAAAEEYCHAVAALSPWHAEFLIHSGLEMKNGRVISLPNGVDTSRYPREIFEEKVRGYTNKANPKFVYSSSPDRGLWHLLKVWGLILKSFPDAQLDICYGLDKYLQHMRWAHSREAQMCVEIEELLNQPGVVNRGKIGQTELAKLQLEADAWLYPLDPLWPTETGCITAVENAAAGNPLVFSKADCLESEFGRIGVGVDLPFDAEEFGRVVQVVLTDEDLRKTMQARARRFAQERSWDLIGAKWVDMLEKIALSLAR